MGGNEAVDHLNAAQTGAFVSNLMHEVKGEALSWTEKIYACLLHYSQYRLPHPSSQENGIPDSAWKLIMMQIGSNDLCRLCVQSELGIGPGSPDDFEAKIRAVLEYMKLHLREQIPNCYHPLTETLRSYSKYRRESVWSIQGLRYLSGSGHFSG